MPDTAFLKQSANVYSPDMVLPAPFDRAGGVGGKSPAYRSLITILRIGYCGHLMCAASYALSANGRLRVSETSCDDDQQCLAYILNPPGGPYRDMASESTMLQQWQNWRCSNAKPTDWVLLDRRALPPGYIEVTTFAPPASLDLRMQLLQLSAHFSEDGRTMGIRKWPTPDARRYAKAKGETSWQRAGRTTSPPER